MKKRNYGIDVARIMAMLFVLLLHNLSFGKLLMNPALTTTQSGVIWYLESGAAVAVNVFAMITGYLMTGRRFKGYQVLNVVLQTLFWSWLALLIIFHFETFTWDLFKSFGVPLTRFWYVNAYVGLMLLFPFIDRGIQHVSKRQAFAVIVVLIFICVTVGFSGHFMLERGYSAFWLVVMYLIGAYLKRFPSQHKGTWLTWGLGYLIFTTMSVIAEKFADELGTTAYHFIDYDSPMILLASICFFCFCLQLKITSGRLQRILTAIAPLAFGAYLIDMVVVHLSILSKVFLPMMQLNPVVMLIGILGMTLLMFMIFILLDFIRAKLFQFLRINQFSKWIEQQLKNGLYRLSDWC